MMLNLLNGEFYKLRKSRCFHVCCIMMVVSVLFVYGMYYLADLIQSGKVESGAVSITVTENSSEELEEASILANMDIADMLSELVAGRFALIITALFTCLFVVGEYSNGAVKNVVGKGYTRGQILAAKFLVIGIAVAVQFLLCSGVNLLAGLLFFGTKELNGAFWADYILYTLLVALLLMALNGFLAAVSELCRNAGISVLIGILFTGGFSELFCELLDLLLHRFEFQVSDYWITQVIEDCPVGAFDAQILERIFIVAVLWSAVSLFVGMLHFKKADL